MIDFSILPAITQNIIILISVVAIKIVISQFSTDNSMRYFRFYCQRLSDKVNKPSNSHYQQKISGLVALFITLTPIIVIVWLFEEFIAIKWLWQSLLLYISLGSFHFSSLGNSIQLALKSDNKNKARELLQQECLRDTSMLSTFGLSKATIEMQLLKHLQLHIIVGCCFLFVGPIMALSYRLLLEMHYSWNTKIKRFQYFGLASNFLLQLVLWLPLRLYYCLYLLTTLGQRTPLFLRSTWQYFFQLNTNIIIMLHALKLNTQLAGVAMYSQQKLRRSNINSSANQADISDIVNASKQLFVIDILIVILLLAIAIFGYLLPLITS